MVEASRSSRLRWQASVVTHNRPKELAAARLQQARLVTWPGGLGARALSGQSARRRNSYCPPNSLGTYVAVCAEYS